jgi:hypothetical protein
MGGWHSTQTFELSDLWSYKPAFITSLAESESIEENFTMYPNPARNYLNLEFEDKNEYSEFVLMDLKGNEVLVKNLNNSILNYRVDVTSIPSGIYFYQVRSNETVYSGKLSVIKNI